MSAPFLPRYSRQQLLEHIRTGINPDYLFFWGHTPTPGQTVGRFIFSQWYNAPFTVDGHTYPTAEHWMMAGKAKLFQDEQILHRIYQSTKPGDVKALGRQIKNFDLQKWDVWKYAIVVAGNVYKFQQHPDLQQYLMTTHTQVLVEASPVDAVWGIGLAADHPSATQPAQWKGDNLLGFALMEVRDILLESRSAPTLPF